MQRLKDVIRKEWQLDLILEDEDLDMRLIEFAEELACHTEKTTLEEVYKLNLGHPDLHLPGLIAATIVCELNLDPHKVNAGMTLREILVIKNV